MNRTCTPDGIKVLAEQLHWARERLLSLPCEPLTMNMLKNYEKIEAERKAEVERCEQELREASEALLGGK